MMLLDIKTFVGHLHPLIVHLTIGFLLLAMLFEMISYLKKYEYLKSAVPFSLTLGFVSAVISCICGYTLSLTGDYDYEELNNHKNGGILVAIISGILVLMNTGRFKKIILIRRAVFSVSCGLLVFILMYTGHQGGRLTHGSDYFSFSMITEKKREKPANVEEAFLFEDVVHPILMKRCSPCHREGKQKGKLSMVSLDALTKGGKSGPAVVDGRLDESELFRRISLDPSHEDFMPADGKTPLTKGETTIIAWWIDKGMTTNGKKIGELKGADEIKPAVAVFLELAGANSVSDFATIERMEINPEIPSDVNIAIVDSLVNKGVAIRIMLHNPVLLDVTVPPASGDKIGSIRDDLMVISKNVIWLNLSDNGLTASDLDFLPMMTNLEKLRLEKNPIGDDIADQLSGLNHLEAVNLNETRISNVCLDKLKEMPSLRRIYSWQTGAK